MPDDRDRLAAAIEELYGTAPEAFTGRRGELVSSAREAGDRGAAKAIGELRRPTRAAWVVNQLSRADPGAPRRLAELSAALSAAQRSGHGPRLREMSAARGALVDALTAQALRLAGVTDAPSSLREEVSGTLTAAVADPGVAAEFAAGTLTRAAQWSGFGVLPPASADNAGGGAVYGGTGNTERSDGPGAELTSAAVPHAEAGAGAGVPGADAVPADRAAGRAGEPAAAVPGQRGPGGGAVRSDGATSAGHQRRSPPQTGGREAGTREAGTGEAGTGEAGTGEAGRAQADSREAGAREADGTLEAGVPGAVRRGRSAREAREARAAAGRQREADERLAREAAERAARRRELFAESERSVALATAAAAEAVAAEDRLEAEVRRLEERLTQARSELAAARMRARHAETAERRTRQAFERMPDS